jgi:DNA-binding MarR family transcriptional regulator
MDQAKLQMARTECAVLKYCTSPVTVSDLARQTDVARTTVSAAVVRLVDSGVLKRVEGGVEVSSL